MSFLKNKFDNCDVIYTVFDFPSTYPNQVDNKICIKQISYLNCQHILLNSILTIYMICNNFRKFSKIPSNIYVDSNVIISGVVLF